MAREQQIEQSGESLKPDSNSSTIRSMQNFVAVAKEWAVILTLVLVAVQLFGIWQELRGIRQEQLKNYYSTLPNDVKAELTDQLAVSRLEGTAYVKVDEPVRVHVDNEP